MKPSRQKTHDSRAMAVAQPASLIPPAAPRVLLVNKFTRASVAAFALAFRMASTQGAELTILNIADPLQEPAPDDGAMLQPWDQPERSDRHGLQALFRDHLIPTACGALRSIRTVEVRPSDLAAAARDILRPGGGMALVPGPGPDQGNAATIGLLRVAFPGNYAYVVETGTLLASGCVFAAELPLILQDAGEPLGDKIGCGLPRNLRRGTGHPSLAGASTRLADPSSAVPVFRHAPWRTKFPKSP